ncbi:MAG: ATP-binding protein [Chloroflexota bacterium]
MSFRVRLTVFYAAILTGFFLCFAGIGYYMVRRTLLNGIDENLSRATEEILESTDVFLAEQLTFLKFPDDMGRFRSASIFMVVVNPQGQIIKQSDNMTGYNGTLTSIDSQNTRPHIATVNIANQHLRVYTSPMVIPDLEVDGGQRLIGHIQVAQLMDSTQTALNQLGVVLLVTGGAVFICFLFLGAGTTHNLLKPLADITTLALQITRTEDLSTRIQDNGRRDEIGDLTMALNQTFERLEKIFRSQQRLLADVSHELRTPLTTLRGYLDLMARMGEGDPESIEIMQDEVQRMSRLVGDLLLLARADGGGIPLRLERMELDTVILDVYRQLQPLGQEKNVTVMLKGLTPARILGDNDRMKQLFIILVDNAIKYTPPGGQVDLQMEHTGQTAYVTIEDSGMGIPQEHLPYIFDRFYRVDKARTRQFGGSGLGLSIAKWIITVHKGEVKVTSEPGIGTKFVISLPTLEDSHPLPDLSEPEKPTRANRPMRLPLPRLRGQRLVQSRQSSE